MPQTVTTAPAPAPARPRPPVLHDFGQLFREPVYADGQPYADDEDDDQDA